MLNVSVCEHKSTWKALCIVFTHSYSLPADVPWGPFVSHAFLLPWGRNECVTNEPQRTSAGRLALFLIRCKISLILQIRQQLVCI